MSSLKRKRENVRNYGEYSDNELLDLKESNKLTESEIKIVEDEINRRRKLFKFSPTDRSSRLHNLRNPQAIRNRLEIVGRFIEKALDNFFIWFFNLVVLIAMVILYRACSSI